MRAKNGRDSDWCGFMGSEELQDVGAEEIESNWDLVVDK